VVITSCAPGLEPAGDRPPRRPAERTGDHRERQVDRGRQVPREPHPPGARGAHDELAGGADVEQAGLERQGHRQAGERQRRRLDQRAAQGAGRPQRAVVQRLVGLEHDVPRGPQRPVGVARELAPLLERVGVGEDDDQAADHQGRDQGEGGHDQAVAQVPQAGHDGGTAAAATRAAVARAAVARAAGLAPVAAGSVASGGCRDGPGRRVPVPRCRSAGVVARRVAHVTTTSSSATGSTSAASATEPAMSSPTRSRSASARSRTPTISPP
jgi:hypothetical protein